MSLLMEAAMEWLCYGLTVGTYFAIMFWLYKRARR